jgi:hypothetical protein
MSSATQVPDQYEFYPCLVDGAPASIYLNLRYEDEPRTETTAYWLAVKMLDEGEHGIGTAEEGELLNAIEEAVIARASVAGLVYVGRVRTRGIWEMTFYGPAGRLDVIRGAAKDLAIGRKTEAHSKTDAAWSYYRELLLPDAERRQWMDDRRLVQVLKEQGDALVTPRRVDHWAYFPSAAARDAFVDAAGKQGFEHDADDDQTAGRFGAHVFRTDPIELDHVHDVVMLLVDAAHAQGGEYDGWETSIERA